MATSTIHTIDVVRAAVVQSGDAAGLFPPTGGGHMNTTLEALGSVCPVMVTVYLVARLLAPALLIVYTTRDASAEQRIALLRDYLLAGSTLRGQRR